MGRVSVLMALAISIAAMIVIFTIIPLCYPYGTFTHLDGSPSIMDHDWSDYGIVGAIYSIGDILCHQQQSRTFMLNGSEMPMCIRDVGLLVGAVIGFTCCFTRTSKLGDNRTLITGFILLVPTLAEWCCEHAFDLDLPILRFILAVISGFGAAMIVSHLIFREWRIDVRSV